MNQPPIRLAPRRHRVARAGAAALAVALSVPWLLAGPASAENLGLTIDSPVDGRVYERTTLTVEGRVDAAFGTVVDTIKVVVWRPGHIVTDENLCPCEAGSSVPFSVTTGVMDTNGSYNVRVVASGYLLLNGIRVNDVSADRSFGVAVRPAAPTNLKAERLPDNKVQLTWGAVPAYPDLLGYVVYRAAPGAPFKPVKGGLKETTWVDAEPAAAGGNFQYRVAAVRLGASPDPKDSSQWLTSESNVASISVPPPSAPTSTGISLPANTNGTSGAGTGADTGAASVDLGQFFSSAAADFSLPTLPGPTSLQLPDTGFNPNLPFGNTAGLTPPAQTGRPSTSLGGTRPPTAAGAPSSAEDRDANRRALLIPVAAGSVLCVAALHLRWLSRRLAVSALAGGGVDLEPAEPELDLDLDLEPRQPVGAGAGAGSGPRVGAGAGAGAGGSGGGLSGPSRP